MQEALWRDGIGVAARAQPAHSGSMRPVQKVPLLARPITPTAMAFRLGQGAKDRGHLLGHAQELGLRASTRRPSRHQRAGAEAMWASGRPVKAGLGQGTSPATSRIAPSGIDTFGDASAKWIRRFLRSEDGEKSLPGGASCRCLCTRSRARTRGLAVSSQYSAVRSAVREGFFRLASCCRPH